MGGAITISNREEKGPCMVAWRALDENEYEHPNIAVSESRFLGALLQRWMFCKGSHSRGDHKVQLGIAPPLEPASRSSVRTCQVSELQYFTLLCIRTWEVKCKIHSYCIHLLTARWRSCNPNHFSFEVLWLHTLGNHGKISISFEEHQKFVCDIREDGN